jgi:hypothetical protein
MRSPIIACNRAHPATPSGSRAFRCRLQGQAAGRAYKEHETVLLACQHGDEVVRNAYGVDPTPTIEVMRPDLIVIDVDEAARDYYAQTTFTNRDSPSIEYTPIIL